MDAVCLFHIFHYPLLKDSSMIVIEHYYLLILPNEIARSVYWKTWNEFWHSFLSSPSYLCLWLSYSNLYFSWFSVLTYTCIIILLSWKKSAFTPHEIKLSLLSDSSVCAILLNTHSHYKEGISFANILIWPSVELMS